MKKLIIAAAMLLMGIAASAQVHIGGGYTWQTFNQKDSDLYWSLDGAYGGASFNIKVNEYVGIAPGAYFIWATGPLMQKKESRPDASIGLDMMELQVPIHVTFGVDMGNAGKIFIYGGPSLGVNLTAKLYGYTKEDMFKNRKNTLTDNLMGDLGDEEHSEIALKRCDAKIGVGVGYRIKFFEFNAGYDFGLLNISKQEGNTLHQNTLHAGIAFCF